MGLEGIGGVLCVLIGLGWIGQGTDLIKGSPVMSGHMEWAIIGLFVLLVGAWLLWTVFRSRRLKRQQV